MPPLLWIFVFLLMCGQTSAQIAVIVNAKNPVESLTKAELRRIYLAEVIRWEFTADQTEDIILVDNRGEAEVGERFYKATVDMSPVKVRMKWLGRILNGELDSLPISMASERRLLRFVAQNVGAIGFVRAKDLDPRVTAIKALEIDGKGIGHKDYPIR